MVSIESRSRSHAWFVPRGTRPICAQWTVSPLWWNSAPRRSGEPSWCRRRGPRRSLRAQQPQRGRECGGTAAALEDDVGVAVAGTVPPASLEQDGRVGPVRVDGLQPEPLGGNAALRRRVEQHHLRGPVPAGEEAGEQPDDPAADHRDPPPAHSVAEVADVGAAQVGRGVQQPVRADRAHMGDVDPE
jgi:hypothetical protein